jgi:hypothetical protein
MKIQIEYDGSIAKTNIDGKCFQKLEILKKIQVINGLKAVLKEFQSQINN